MEDLLSPDKLLSFAINIGASFAAAWSAFLWLGRKWIESRLSKELEYHKAVHAQELEKLKHRMSATFDRLTRLHDREFEVLPDIWGKLVEVRRWAGGYVSSVKSYPNVANLEDYALQEQLDKLGFEEWQKTEILESDNRQDTFNAACDEIHYEDVKEKISEFYDFFEENRYLFTRQ